MVRAILDDRKTQTRRTKHLETVNENPDRWHVWHPELGPDEFGCFTFTDNIQGEKGVLMPVACPYGKAGDRLWVRETWAYCSKCADRTPEVKDGVIYAADGDGFSTCHICNPKTLEPDYRWRPSIFMPRWASRINLEITGIRVERVQNIAPLDCVAEGASEYDTLLSHDTHIDRFRHLWDSINEKRGYGWDANPWVWVIEFKRLQASPNHD